jgi:hypothetical protein
MERRATGRKVDHCIAYARDVSPAIEVLPVSAESGEGVAAWCQRLRDARTAHATMAILLAEPAAHIA